MSCFQKNGIIPVYSVKNNLLVQGIIKKYWKAVDQQVIKKVCSNVLFAHREHYLQQKLSLLIFNSQQLWFTYHLDHKPSVTMSWGDSREVMGSKVYAKALHLTSLVECSRIYKSRAKINDFHGTVLYVVNKKTFLNHNICFILA